MFAKLKVFCSALLNIVVVAMSCSSLYISVILYAIVYVWQKCEYTAIQGEYNYLRISSQEFGQVR
jgi:hypothetical protein